MDEPFIVAEVAVLLNVSPAYVVERIRDGKLPASANADARYTVACCDAEAYRHLTLRDCTSQYDKAIRVWR